MKAKAAPRSKISRPLALSAASVLLGVGLVVVGAAATGAPAADASFLGLCDADETLPVPASPYGSQDGITYSTTALTGYSVVAPTSDQNTTIAQYAGAGLSWNTFGMSCMDASPQMQTLAANWVFTILTVFPLRVLGVMLQLAFSTTIADTLINAAQPIVTSLSTNVFTRWLPLALFVVLVVAAIRMAAQRGRQAWTPVAFSLLVTGLMGTLVVNGTGLSLLRSVNDATRDVTNCVMFGAAGVGCTTNTVDPTAMFTDGMVESLASSSWGAGAVGDLVQTTAPTTLHITAHDGTPSFTTDQDVAVPVDAIPARVPGAPTYAEVIRWTQTYTNAEMAAMSADPSKQCLTNPDQSPKIGVVSDPSNEDVNRGQLCSYKWLVRTAVLSDLYTSHPAQYTTLRGAGSESIVGAMSGIGMLPLALGIGVMGFLVLLYQLKLVFLAVASPVIALLSMHSTATVRQWGGQMGATLVKRIAVGLVLGIVLWATSAINTGLITAISTPYATINVPIQFVPVVTSLAVIALMVAGWMMLSSLRDIMLTSVSLPAGGSSTDRLKSGAMKAVEIGVGAGRGALAAGSGARLLGAWRGLSRSNAFGGDIGRAYRSGDYAGRQLAARRAHEQREAEHTSEQQLDHDAEVRASRAVRDAVEGLRSSPESAAARRVVLDDQLDDLARARDRARAAVLGFMTSPDELAAVRARVEQLRASGLSPELARARADKESDVRRAALAETLEVAESELAEAGLLDIDSISADDDDFVQGVRTALLGGTDPDDLAERMGVSGATRVTIREYADALREEARRTYYRVKMSAGDPRSGPPPNQDAW